MTPKSILADNEQLQTFINLTKSREDYAHIVVSFQKDGKTYNRRIMTHGSEYQDEIIIGKDNIHPPIINNLDIIVDTISKMETWYLDYDHIFVEYKRTNAVFQFH